MFLYNLLITVLWASTVFAAPAPTKTPPNSKDESDGIDEEVISEADSMDTGLFYDQYLQQVIKLLESDEGFKKKMETANFDDIKEGKLSQEVNFMPQEIRNQLNELKKEEVRRLRKMVHAKTNLDKGRKVQKTQYLAQIAQHLDHDNPHTFEAADLTNLIKAATGDLENFDKERHEEFKKYEMNREVERQKKMDLLNDLDRQNAEEDFLKHQKEAAQNKGIRHPGSKAQLEEVWNEEDGLNEQEFNPRTFFSLHDVNGDGYLDEIELESLFETELEKAYNTTNPNGDIGDFMQMEEERRRMREHVVKEVDKDGDGLVSLGEFLSYTNSAEFANPVEDTYKTIDQMLMEHSLYTKEELEKYQNSIAQQEMEIKQKLEVLKAEAKSLSGMRKELNEHKKQISEDGHVGEVEKITLELKEQEIKQKEEKLQEIHKDLQQQSKDVLEMKQQVQKHEVGEKVVDQIKQKLDDLPEGADKQKELEKARKDLENLKQVQEVAGHVIGGMNKIPVDDGQPPKL